MKAKVTRGCGVKGLLRYAFDVGPKATGSKRAEQVGGNMIGQDIGELEQEFGIVYRLRPDISKPVWHCSLSLPKGERLSKDKWDKVVADFLKEMQFDLRLTQYVAVRHQDTKYDHVHIIVSRVGMNAKVWLGQWEARRVIEATQELEIRHGLTQTVGLGSARAAKRRPGLSELKMEERTEEETVRSRLQSFVDVAVEGNPTAVMFAAKMVEQGAEVRVNFSKTGEVNGFSYQLDGVCIQSGQLGKQYSWRGLKERGVTYDQDRDHAELLKFSHQAAVDPKINNDDTAPGMVVGVQQQVGIDTTEPLHVEAVAANIESFDLLTQGSQVSMPDAELVHVETHHAEMADPSVESPSFAEISSESLPPGISSDATVGGSSVTNDSQDAETTSIYERAAEPIERAQVDMEIGSELVALPVMEGGDENYSSVDSGSISSSHLLVPSAEDPVLTEVVDEKDTLLVINAGAVEDDVQILETIQESAAKDTLLTEGEDPIVQSRLLAADESSFSAGNVSDNKTVPEESHKELNQEINQSGAVIEVVALEDKNIGTASVVSVTDTPMVTQAEPLASQVAVVSDKETMSKKLADLDEKLSSKIAPKGPGM